ncbi:MAG: hypothetical protein COT84_05440 [Chlamydiae bacterium CG10_big_fil_rev_8_21_14_0_10_35_9]|nr:MAG: hypothetical protein COT84_05440 [Chlamydiae bacterium CG10_big_fil_rev_8_21_14_0_10_35_9]
MLFVCLGIFQKVDASDIFVDLNNPTYLSGVLSTNDGGVIVSDDLRIQAKNIEYAYFKKNGQTVHTIKASENLMLQYKDKVFTGEELDFDLTKNTGIIRQGKTFISPWYLGGDEILIHNTDNYTVTNAFATTCLEKDSMWNIKAREVDVLNKELFYAKDITFTLFGFPALWLPIYKLNLKKFSDPSILKYNMTWDKGVGPRATIRYQIYSWREWAFYVRGDFRLKKDYGGAIETEYLPSHKRAKLLTKNYLAKDILPTDPRNKRRYRYQGDGYLQSESGKTKATITWDKYSDIHMPSDFKSEDFELNPAKKTAFYVRHFEDTMIALLKARGRANSFESVKQDLPTAFMTFIPYKFPKLGIYSNNYTKGSYLDYVFSEDLETNINDFRSFRLESHHEIYRPFLLGPLAITPQLGAVGIYYSRSPQNKEVGLGILSYGAKATTKLKRTFSQTKHLIEPYVSYKGLSKPTIGPNNHFIFSLEDGYDRINQLQIGCKNVLFSHEKATPFFTANLYANAFFADLDIPQTFPKLYLDLNWNFPKVELAFYNAWNFRHQTVDYSNFFAAFTLNEDFAFKFEVRYRSKYDWRKADKLNFILDVSREESELLSSPISDRRITLLTNLFFRLSPYWSCHVQSHHGWYRIDEPPYNEVKVDLYTTISSAWLVKFTYWHTETDDRFSVGIDLIRGK